VNNHNLTNRDEVAQIKQPPISMTVLLNYLWKNKDCITITDKTKVNTKLFNSLYSKYLKSYYEKYPDELTKYFHRFEEDDQCETYYLNQFKEMGII